MSDQGSKTFRYRTSGHWFKGNTHIHSIASDGGMDVPEIAGLYHGKNYDFLFCTDHWVCSNVEEAFPHTPLLLLDGIELDGRDRTGSLFHVVCLGKTEGISREDGLEGAMQKARGQNALLVLAHPRWMGNSTEDALRHGFDGVEVYNHVCRWLNGKSDGFTYYDTMLGQNPAVLSIAADDAHLRPEHPGYNGGWIMVNMPELTRENVLAAIRAGNYYSSCGPAFKSIILDGRTLHIGSSPVQCVRISGPASQGWRTGSFDGPPFTQTSVVLTDDMLEWGHMYIELEDDRGKRAWSNTLFV